MANIEPLPSLAGIISESSKDSGQAKQQLNTATFVGQVVSVVSKVPYKSENYAKTREEALGKYFTARYTFNDRNINDNAKVWDSLGKTALSVVKGSTNQLPKLSQPGVPPNAVNHSVEFVADNGGFTGEAKMTAGQLNYWNWSVGVTFRVTSYPPAGSNSVVWSFEDGVNDISMRVSPTGQILFGYNGTYSIVHASAIGGIWHSVTTYSSGANIYFNIDGESSGTVTQVRPLYTMGTATLSIGYSPKNRAGGLNRSLAGAVEELYYYSDVEFDDRTTPWAGNAKYSSNWQYYSTYPWRNAPAGWALCDGSVLLAADYAKLFAQIGTVYGGNGTTTFQIPTASPDSQMYRLIRTK